MSFVRTLAHLFPLDSQARLLARTVSPAHRYRAAVRLCRLHGRMRGVLGGNARLSDAYMLDFWLRSLTHSGPFPIPFRIADPTPLQTLQPGRGVFMCTAHAPFAQVALRAVVELGHRPSVIADSGNIINSNQILVCGLQQRASAIPADAHSLIRLRTILRSGGMGVCFADATTGAALSGAAMQLAGRLGCPTLLVSVVRRVDDVFELAFTPPPFPYSENAGEVAANLAALLEQNRRILATLGLPYSSPRWPRATLPTNTIAPAKTTRMPT